MLINFGLNNGLLILQLSAIVLIQVLTGMLFFSFSDVSKRIDLISFTVISFALGTTLNIVIDKFLLNFEMSRFSLLITFALGTTGTPKLISRIKYFGSPKPINRDHLFFLLILVLIFELQIRTLMKFNPIVWQGWQKFHIDVGYYESLSNSLAVMGPIGSFMDPDGEVRYHWFAYSLIGQLNYLTQAEPFFVLTRFFPVIILLISALAMFAFTSLFLQKLHLRYLAVIILLLGPGLSLGSLVPLWSPSSILAIPYCLGFLIYVFELLKVHSIGKYDVAILFVLSLGLMGSKSTSAVVIALSFFLTGLHMLKMNGRDSYQKLRVLILANLSLVISYVMLIRTSEKRSLSFEFFLGWPSLMMTSLGLYLGLVLTFRQRLRKLDESIIFYYIFFCGAALSLVTRDSFGNQLYFFYTALIIATPISLSWLFNYNFENLKNSRQFKLWIVSILIVSFLPVWMFRYFETSTGLRGDVGRGLSPALMLLIIGMFYVLAIKANDRSRITKGSHLFLCIVLMVTLATSSIMTFSEYVFGIKYSRVQGVTKIGVSEPREPGAISYDYVQAGKWVTQNIPKNQMGFTNRQCFDALSEIESCDTRWFFASALSKRKFLVEGSAYSSKNAKGSSTLSIDERISINFSKRPDPTTLRYLLSKGVTWGWIDKAVTGLEIWDPYAQVLYQNPQVTIIRLTG